MREKREKIAIWIKGTLTACGYVFLFATWMLDPANIITITGESPAYDDGARAASFALIAAMAIAVSRIPAGETAADKAIEWSVWILMAFATFMAAWWWLADETNGNPQVYLEEMLFVAGALVIAGVASLALGAGGSALLSWRPRARSED